MPMLTSPWLLAGAILLVGAGVSWTTDAVASEERVAGVRERDAWSETGAFRYVVPVEGEAAPRPMGEPGYFTTRSPRVPVGFDWSANDPGHAAPEGDARMTLVVRASAVNEKTWSVELPLDDAPLHEGRATLEGVLDFEEAHAAIDAARLEHGKRNETLEWSIFTAVAFSRKEEPRVSEFSFPIRYDPPLYVLPGNEAAASTRQHAIREPYEDVSRPGLRGLLEDPRGPAALLAAAACFVVLARRAPPQPEALQ